MGYEYALYKLLGLKMGVSSTDKKTFEQHKNIKWLLDAFAGMPSLILVIRMSF